MTRRLVLLCAALLLPTAALAQGGRWEVEFHGGGTFVGAPGGGTTSVPAPGGPFTTVTGSTSRAVPSWYFGDGTRLLNDFLTSFGVSNRIMSLDPVLNTPLVERSTGAGVGFRLGREITPRFGAEFNLDITSTPMRLTGQALAGVEASRASFVPAFVDGVLATGPFSRVTAASDVHVATGTSRQIAATGALNINLRTRGRVTPYATVGAGLIVNQGEPPAVDLDGSYAFDMLGLFPIAEHDSVQFRHVDDTTFVGVLGAGFKTRITPRSGIRVDARVHVGRDTARTLLNADPDRAPAGPATARAVASYLTPGIQFSNSDALGPTTLSGASVDDFKSFSADGLFTQGLITVGYFWRFW